MPDPTEAGPAHRIGPATARVGIMGWPVDHSISPRLHNAVQAARGIDAHYHRLPIPPPQLARSVRALAVLGWRGVNVTIPHKVAVLELCDEVSREAQSIGAVNVLTVEDGRIVGDNTDARGWLASLREETDFRDASRAVVFGTGGAARAVVVALARAEATITVVGRQSVAVAELVDLAAAHGAVGATGCSTQDLSTMRAVADGADLVVNATPLGMREEPLPDALMHLRTGQIASDLVYRAGTTPFLAAAAAAGAEIHPGVGMLLGQAALTFSQWHGGVPPLADFRAAVAAG